MTTRDDNAKFRCVHAPFRLLVVAGLWMLSAILVSILWQWSPEAGTNVIFERIGAMLFTPLWIGYAFDAAIRGYSHDPDWFTWLLVGLLPGLSFFAALCRTPRTFWPSFALLAILLLFGSSLCHRFSNESTALKAVNSTKPGDTVYFRGEIYRQVRPITNPANPG